MTERPYANSSHQPAQDVLLARDRLLDLVHDFPFARPVDRAAWLSGLLSICARSAYDGPTPFFLVEGEVGCGKSLLCQATAMIGCGKRMPAFRQVLGEHSQKAWITAVARAAEPVVLIDNIVRPLGGDAFDAALTGTSWKVRMTGQKELSTFPLSTVWWGTGQNVRFRAGADTARRVLPIRLRPGAGLPERRHPDLLDFIKLRPHLAQDARSLVRAFQRTAAPEPVPLAPWGSFEEWSAVIRNAVVWLGLPDPVGGRS